MSGVCRSCAYHADKCRQLGESLHFQGEGSMDAMSPDQMTLACAITTRDTCPLVKSDILLTT